MIELEDKAIEISNEAQERDWQKIDRASVTQGIASSSPTYVNGGWGGRTGAGRVPKSTIQGQSWDFFQCGHPAVPASFVEKIVLSLMNDLACLLKTNWPHVCGFISGVPSLIPGLSFCQCHTVTTVALCRFWIQVVKSFRSCSFSELFWLSRFFVYKF